MEDDQPVLKPPITCCIQSIPIYTNMYVCLSVCLPAWMYVCYIYMYIRILYVYSIYCIICMYYMSILYVYTCVYIYISYIYIIVFAVTFQTGSRRGSQYRPCCTAPCSSKLSIKGASASNRRSKWVSPGKYTRGIPGIPCLVVFYSTKMMNQ